MDIHPVRSWLSPSELGGLVSRSLVREIKINPRPGWIRNDGSSPISLLERINNLTEENKQLRDKVEIYDNELDDASLSSGNDKVKLYGERRIRNDSGVGTKNWATMVTWDAMFCDIGPALINETTEDDLRDTLARFHDFDELPRGSKIVGSAYLKLESWNEVLIQFRALGLITQGAKKRGVNDKASYWRITPKGDRHLVNLLARRRDAVIENT